MAGLVPAVVPRAHEEAKTKWFVHPTSTFTCQYTKASGRCGNEEKLSQNYIILMCHAQDWLAKSLYTYAHAQEKEN
jgi:hypothetical protein